MTAVAVILALALTGTVSAPLGGSAQLRSALRAITGGVLAVAATTGMGALIAPPLWPRSRLQTPGTARRAPPRTGGGASCDQAPVAGASGGRLTWP